METSKHKSEIVSENKCWPRFAHLLVVLVQAERVAEVARLLVIALGPSSQLEDAAQAEEGHEAIAAGRSDGSSKAGRHRIEARELDVVLRNCTQCCHHGHTAVPH